MNFAGVHERKNGSRGVTVWELKQKPFPKVKNTSSSEIAGKQSLGTENIYSCVLVSHRALKWNKELAHLGENPLNAILCGSSWCM